MDDYIELDIKVHGYISKVLEKRKSVPHQCLNLERQRISLISVDDFVVPHIKSDKDLIWSLKDLKQSIKVLESQPDSRVHSKFTDVQKKLTDTLNYLNVRAGLYSR